MQMSDPSKDFDSSVADGASTRPAPGWHWFLPTSGDGRQVTNVIDLAGQAEVSREADIPYLTEVALAAERAGFDAVLTPTGSGCEDSWVVCAAVAQRTERLRFLVAFRPDTISPAWAAHQAASFQRLTGGRLLLNIVSGGDPVEQKSFGDFADKEERYRRTAEFLEVVRQSWEGQPFDHDGVFFRIEQGGLKLGLEPFGPPPVFFGGSSAPGQETAARFADVYLTWGEPLEAVRTKIESVKERARSHGRDIRCGLRVHIISRDTEDEAWAEADRMLSELDPAAIEAARKKFARMESEGQARMTELASGGDNDSLVVGPNLWAGIGLVREGAGTALVGSHDQVADRLIGYHEIGIDEFILSGYPHLEEALRFGESVRPLLNDKLPQEPSPPVSGAAG